MYRYNGKQVLCDDLAKLTPTGADFLRTIAHDDWWRTDEGARVPQSLVKSGMVERADGIGGKIYRITAAGILARAALSNIGGSNDVQT